ncbi:GNAT family N-acetyltransferase [Pandoraea pnomenusa]|uniref:GNAT family N-acetyltransferase n=1 Tax=Pandoraea pnomenusa TaxID=93220 RepID=UPI000A6B2A74|nr:GNAT family N-acetyltransferase [Pandoraea pnomenusa]
MSRQRAARVRLATPADVPAMAVVERSAAARFRTLPELAWLADGEPIAAADQLAWIAAGTAWVATDPDDAPVGLLDAEVFGTALHVWELSVHRSWQGRGIGRALLDAAIGHACEAGLGAVTLTTFRDVAWNAPFYARAGFETINDDTLCARLRAVLARERAAGLSPARRCAMRRRLLTG